MGKVILAIIPIIIGIVLLVTTLQNWNTPSPAILQTRQELNAAANNIVDICLNNIGKDSQVMATCDADLRTNQKEVCDAYSGADICNDGRVEQYYQIRTGPNLDSNEQVTNLSVSDSVEAKVSTPTDFRCFEQRFMTYLMGDKTYYEKYTFIEKEHDQYCDSSNYVYGFDYRMIDVIPVMRWHNEGGYTGIYSEYFFQDDSRITLGEKEIKTFS